VGGNLYFHRFDRYCATYFSTNRVLK
jgi:hypothetical protein